MELDASHLHVTIQRLVPELVLVTMDAEVFAISVDLLRSSVDRSVEQLRTAKHSHDAMPPHNTTPGQETTKLVHREKMFFFVGSLTREIIYSVVAEDLEDACRLFRSSPRRDSPIFSIIKTETEIYLAQ
jgi:hypothetical protein